MAIDEGDGGHSFDRENNHIHSQWLDSRNSGPVVVSKPDERALRFGECTEVCLTVD